MRNTVPFLAVAVLAGALAGGCAGPEKKLGRGFGNMFDIVRMGEVRRTMEQSTLFEEPGYTYGKGFARGLSRELARTGIGIYEVVTFPIPNPGGGYDPVFADSFPPGPVNPDNYSPDLVEDSTFATDSNLGFSGGAVAPNIPGSRFRIFDTH
jgi:putative exosortase-associated protein (TIGR04073 family)